MGIEALSENEAFGWANNSGARTNGWGNNFGGNNFGMQMGNMGNNMGGMMNPQQYQMYYNQMQQGQMGWGNNQGWGQNQGQKRPASGGFNAMFNQAKQAKSSGAGW